jgi:flagella basal body P-ring formation protein FlgA
MIAMLTLMAIAAGAQAPPAPCVRATAPIAAGAVPARSDLADAQCAGRAAPAFRYDPAGGGVTAIRDIAEGETVTAPPLSLLPDVRPGDPLYLVARVGTATVERSVVAAQTGRRGQAVFVRTSEGTIVSARMEGDDR